MPCEHQGLANPIELQLRGYYLLWQYKIRFNQNKTVSGISPFTQEAFW